MSLYYFKSISMKNIFRWDCTTDMQRCHFFVPPFHSSETWYQTPILCRHATLFGENWCVTPSIFFSSLLHWQVSHNFALIANLQTTTPSPPPKKKNNNNNWTMQPTRVCHLLKVDDSWVSWEASSTLVIYDYHQLGSKEKKLSSLIKFEHVGTRCGCQIWILNVLISVDSQTCRYSVRKPVFF